MTNTIGQMNKDALRKILHYIGWKPWVTKHMNIEELRSHVVDEPDINTCPGCGGPADNGFNRCVPPEPYFCKKCEGV